jgi:hypothetical protein
VLATKSARDEVRLLCAITCGSIHDALDLGRPLRGLIDLFRCNASRDLAWQ